MKIKCYLRAIKNLLIYGAWWVHEYRETDKEIVDLFVSDVGFRIADNWKHDENERLIKDATFVKCECRNCGRLGFYYKENNGEVV